MPHLPRTCTQVSRVSPVVPHRRRAPAPTATSHARPPAPVALYISTVQKTDLQNTLQRVLHVCLANQVFVEAVQTLLFGANSGKCTAKTSRIS